MSLIDSIPARRFAQNSSGVRAPGRRQAMPTMATLEPGSAIASVPPTTRGRHFPGAVAQHVALPGRPFGRGVEVGAVLASEETGEGTHRWQPEQVGDVEVGSVPVAQPD